MVFKHVFGKKLKSQLILLFNSFFLLFMGPTALFCIIHRSYCTISLFQLIFTFIYSTFSKKISISIKADPKQTLSVTKIFMCFDNRFVDIFL